MPYTTPGSVAHHVCRLGGLRVQWREPHTGQRLLLVQSRRLDHDIWLFPSLGHKLTEHLQVSTGESISHNISFARHMIGSNMKAVPLHTQ